MQTGGPRLTLALRKSAGLMSGYWEFPGGKQENGESLRECLVREINEELGIAVVPGTYVGVSEYKTDTIQIALHGFLVRQWTGTLELTEHDALLWLPGSALLSLRWCPADVPLVKTVVSKYCQ